MTSISLLLGAGFSIPFGLPSTKELTDLLISEEIKFTKATWGDYYTEKKWRELDLYRGEMDFIEAEKHHNIIRFLHKKGKRD